MQVGTSRSDFNNAIVSETLVPAVWYFNTCNIGADGSYFSKHFIINLKIQVKLIYIFYYERNFYRITKRKLFLLESYYMSLENDFSPKLRIECQLMPKFADETDAMYQIVHGHM